MNVSEVGCKVKKPVLFDPARFANEKSLARKPVEELNEAKVKTLDDGCEPMKSNWYVPVVPFENTPDILSLSEELPV